MVSKNLSFTMLVFTSSLALTACQTASVASGNVPETGLTVSELYAHSVAQQTRVDALPRPLPMPVHYESIGNDKQTDVHIKALANPAIPLYVFAHQAQLGDETIIKPGYTTAFLLYRHPPMILADDV